MEKAKVCDKNGKASAALTLRRLKIAKKKLADEEKVQKGEKVEEELDQIFDKVKEARKQKKEKADLTKAASKDPKRRYTDDGIPIFTEDELKLNNPKAGTTPLCPFDCDCCF